MGRLRLGASPGAGGKLWPAAASQTLEARQVSPGPAAKPGTIGRKPQSGDKGSDSASDSLDAIELSQEIRPKTYAHETKRNAGP